MYVNYCISCATGSWASDSNISVGPHEGTYKRCGLPSNDMSTGEIKSLSCEPDATGTSLMIKRNGKGMILNFCEVLIFGTGMV